MSVKISRENKKGLTLDDVRDFVEECERVGIQSDVVLGGLNTMGGKLRKVSAEG